MEKEEANKDEDIEKPWEFDKSLFLLEMYQLGAKGKFDTYHVWRKDSDKVHVY